MSSHQNHLLRQDRLVFEFSIVANATPALKGRAADVPGVVILRTEGQTADADAVESGIAWTTPIDDDSGDSIFGVLLNLAENIADKVYSVTLTEVSSVSTSEVVTGPGGSASFLTAAGNIAIEIDATELDLATESPTFRLAVDYRLRDVEL
jgi:hypothetical protein